LRASVAGETQERKKQWSGGKLSHDRPSISWFYSIEKKEDRPHNPIHIPDSYEARKVRLVAILIALLKRCARVLSRQIVKFTRKGRVELEHPWLGNSRPVQESVNTRELVSARERFGSRHMHLVFGQSPYFFT
jgi:hypothetical protein